MGARWLVQDRRYAADRFVQTRIPMRFLMVPSLMGILFYEIAGPDWEMVDRVDWQIGLLSDSVSGVRQRN